MSKSKEYWNKRFEQLENAQMNKGAAYFAELEKQYKKASSLIQRDIDVWYARFADNNEISLKEARRLLTSDELEEFKWSVMEYVEKGRTLNTSDQWLKQLKNASAKVHVTRLEAIKLQMQNHIEVLYGNEQDDLAKLLEDIYTEGYYHTAFEIQKGFNVGYDLMKLDTNKIEKVISKPWAADGSNFSDRIWKQKSQLVSELHNNLTQAIIRGQNPKVVTDKIAKRFHVSKNQAGRLVMTESAFFASASNRDCYKDLGVEQYEILATLDSKTSDICQALDGKVFKMSEYEVGVTAPPFHTWCRTTTVPYFDDEFTLDETRAFRDSNGKTDYVPASMKYPEWKKKYLASPSGNARINLKNVVGNAAHESIISNILDNATDVARNVFDHYEGQFLPHEELPSGSGAYFRRSDNKVRLNLDDVAAGTNFNAEYETFFHEYGHNIDYLMGKEYGSGKGLYFSHEYKNGIFEKTLSEECQNTMLQYYRYNLKDVIGNVNDPKYFRWAAQNLGDTALEDRIRDISRGIRNGTNTIDDLINDDEIFGAFVKDYISVDDSPKKHFINYMRQNYPKRALGMLSDTYEREIGIAYPFGYGHDLTYWSKAKDNFATEAFANMYGATLANPESLQAIKIFFPKSYDVFLEMLEVVK